MTIESKESALSRWSRRKLEAQQAEARPAEAGEDETGADEAMTNEVAPAAAEEQPVLTDADMPDIESLSENSDFTPFMSPGVSDKLRNLALRKLFHAPVFNIRDGLDEYDDDFTSFEKLGGIVTADMKHQVEMQQQKLREKLAAEGEQGDVEDEIEADIEELEAELPEDMEDDDNGAQPQTTLAAASTDKSKARTDNDE
ncbi:MAG: DUF3306 domain-containing protein [Gammaproteobacteria bacterium]|nr:MAG: DUF3306 domain-containing protein [Gammaproteobacteria bacterium]